MALKDVVALFLKQSGDDLEKVAQSQEDYHDQLDEYMKRLDTRAKSMIQEATKNYLDSDTATMDRRHLYQLYDEMDDSYSSYISSALDMMSDDATQADIDTGKTLTIQAGKKRIEKELADFITRFAIEERLPVWARSVAKYGDFPVVVLGMPDEGITLIDDTVHPENFERITHRGTLLGFKIEGYLEALSSEEQNKTLDMSQKILPPWGVVHFKLKGSSVVSQGGSLNGIGFKNIDNEYGNSILYPARRAFKELELIETAIILYRLTNSIKKNIFMVDVGQMDFEKAQKTIRNYEELLSKRKTINLSGTGELSAKKNIPSYSEDIFIPTSGEKGIQIEQVGGDVDIKEAMDLQYALNKLCASIKMPKAYLSFEDSLNARSTLIQLDIRYARTVSKIQHAIIAGLFRLFQIHLAYKGIELDDDLDILMTPVSAIEEEVRSEKLRTRIDYAGDMVRLLKEFEDSMGDDSESQYDKQYLMYYTFKDRLLLPDDVLKKLLRFDYSKFEDPNYTAKQTAPDPNVKVEPDIPEMLPGFGGGGRRGGFGFGEEEESTIFERMLRRAPDCRFPAGIMEYRGTRVDHFHEAFTVGYNKPARTSRKVRLVRTLKG